MKIGILQAGHVPDDLSERHGSYPDMFARMLAGHGFTFETWEVLAGKFPQGIHVCDGWLITGSRHGTYEPLEWIPPLEDFIRKAYQAGVPMVGICFGHQIMAQALGGKVEKFAGGWGVGRHRYTYHDGEEFELHAMHQDQVTEKPEEARTIASSEFCVYAALAYRGNAISFQPHPEYNADFARDLLSARAGTVVPSEQAFEAIRQIEGDLDSAKVAMRIATFFKEAGRIAA
jgi:GMP synthase (glutamine-hydrolysing)